MVCNTLSTSLKSNPKYIHVYSNNSKFNKSIKYKSKTQLKKLCDTYDHHDVSIYFDNGNSKKIQIGVVSESFYFAS